MRLHIEVAQQQWDLKKNLHNLLEQGLLEQSLLCQTVFQIQALFTGGIKESDAEEANENTRTFKGQLISKANCQAVNSSKKQTNEFFFTTMRRVFVRFLEDTKKTFEIN